MSRSPLSRSAKSFAIRWPASMVAALAGSGEGGAAVPKPLGCGALGLATLSLALSTFERRLDPRGFRHRLNRRLHKLLVAVTIISSDSLPLPRLKTPWIGVGG